MDLSEVKHGDRVTIVLDNSQRVTGIAVMKSSMKGCWIVRANNGDGRAYFASPENVVEIKSTK